MEVSLRRDVTQRFVMFQWTIGEMQFVAQYGQGQGSLPCARTRTCHACVLTLSVLDRRLAARWPFRSVRCLRGAGGAVI